MFARRSIYPSDTASGGWDKAIRTGLYSLLLLYRRSIHFGEKIATVRVVGTRLLAQHTQITSGVEILMLRQHKQKGWTKTNPGPAPPFDHMLSPCVCSMQ